ncbi:uncharacterized protein G2W53_015270 [Senna tora]|uniref:Uncharacterized protein n=1 Tax=Senna tora TaxID=362788 RepID=A0A835C9J4_9FABA|nr:uncharacterized protein G2W53_015270 [Senna tora]
MEAGGLGYGEEEERRRLTVWDCGGGKGGMVRFCCGLIWGWGLTMVMKVWG